MLKAFVIRRVFIRAAVLSTAVALIASTTVLSTATIQAAPKPPRPAPSREQAAAPALGSATALGAPPSPVAWLDPRFGIAEGFANPGLMSEIGAGWSRAVFSWPQIQPRGAGDFSGLGWTLPRELLDTELRRGTRIVGLVQFTPAWAAENQDHGWRAVPRNLWLPYDHPDNYFGRFVFETVRYYSGWIDEWIVWNEPEFRPGDAGGGESYTWLGSDEEFAQLLKVGYLAAKAANPNVIVSFPATSYWVEELSSPKRPQFYERLLHLISHDPEAAEHNYYHDATALNLYRKPDDLYRIYSVFKAIQHAYSVDKPIWLTETNAMPASDPHVTCWSQPGWDPYATTLEEQAAFAAQAFALAAAAGYERMGFYKMIDDNACHQAALWGVSRDGGARRPVADALRTVVSLFSDYTSAQFVPLARTQDGWSSWPNNPHSYTPNWQIYQVVLERPDDQRVTVLWNGDSSPVWVRIPKNGVSAVALDALGGERALYDGGEWWGVELAGATAYFAIDDWLRDPVGYHYIGGLPVLIVEDGVEQPTSVMPPAIW